MVLFQEPVGPLNVFPILHLALVMVGILAFVAAEFSICPAAIVYGFSAFKAAPLDFFYYLISHVT